MILIQNIIWEPLNLLNIFRKGISEDLSYTAAINIQMVWLIVYENYRWIVMLDFICKGTAELLGKETSEQFKMNV